MTNSYVVEGQTVTCYSALSDYKPPVVAAVYKAMLAHGVTEAYCMDLVTMIGEGHDIFKDDKLVASKRRRVARAFNHPVGIGAHHLEKLIAPTKYGRSNKSVLIVMKSGPLTLFGRALPVEKLTTRREHAEVVKYEGLTEALLAIGRLQTQVAALEGREAPDLSDINAHLNELNMLRGPSPDLTTRMDGMYDDLQWVIDCMKRLAIDNPRIIAKLPPSEVRKREMAIAEDE